MRTLLVVLAMAAACGCGCVGGPLPPALNIPERVTVLNARQHAGQLVIGKSVGSLMFFELLTHTSWILAPGSYEFQRVRVGHRKDDVSWTRTEAPDSVLKAFRGRIGGKECVHAPEVSLSHTKRLHS